MERELADVIRNRVRGQVLDALYRENPVDVPRALIEEQVQQLQLDTARRMGVGTPASCRRVSPSRSRRDAGWRWVADGPDRAGASRSKWIASGCSRG